MARATILVVDDELNNVDSLERLFRSRYNVLKATSGSEALATLNQNKNSIAVILTDQRMPGMTGVELLEKSLEGHPHATRMLLTAYADIDSIVSAVNSGQIFRYIHKPWDPVDLLNTVEQGVVRFDLAQELEQKNKHLQEALDELKTLDQAKNQFMILVNHELKTPLTSILSFSELLRESRPTEEQSVCIDRIHKSAEKLKAIVDDVLLVVKTEMKLLQIKVHGFDCRNLLLSLPSEITHLIKQKNLVLNTHWIEKRILGDQEMLEQVLRRLLHNACKFSLPESIIDVRADLTHPHRVRFSVYNRGPQISPHIIDKIHRPFFLDEDVMNHSVGMGLGLTICHSILRAHNAPINIKNKDSGVEVSFELPCL